MNAEQYKVARATRNALEAMQSVINCLDLSECSSLVSSDLEHDKGWVHRVGCGDRFYWVITTCATGIGQDPSLTVDYYREQTPGSVIACYLWTGSHLLELPKKSGVACSWDDRTKVPSSWGDKGERVQL